MSKFRSASRREFLTRTAAMSAMGIAAPSLLNMSAVSRVAAATATDYKALVCVFMYGANDHYNTFVPFDNDNHAIYKAARPELALNQSQVQSTILTPSVNLPDSKVFALAPQLADLHSLWNQQKLSVLLNVGPLVQPTSKSEYSAASVPLPPKIFSHNDQQSIWQSLAPEGATNGWGGQIMDLFLNDNNEDTFSCVSLAGDSIFLSGQASIQYHITPKGSINLSPSRFTTYGSSAVSSAALELMRSGQAHLIKKAHRDIAARSIEANAVLTSALNSAPQITTSFGGGSLSAQLKMVAKMIAARNALGMKRQIFFVGMGGFDVHSGFNSDHPPLLKELNDALYSFNQVTDELGVGNKVTTFTASEFGRTLSSNGDGTDHGWGGHHMIMGGGVNGGEYFGTAPALGDDGPDDIGRGRLLPTTSVEQMAATLGLWFGCSNSELQNIFPSLSSFNSSDIGFMS